MDALPACDGSLPGCPSAVGGVDCSAGRAGRRTIIDGEFSIPGELPAAACIIPVALPEGGATDESPAGGAASGNSFTLSGGGASLPPPAA